MRCFVQLVNPFFSAVFVNYLISLTFCKGPLRSRSRRGTNYSKAFGAAQVPFVRRLIQSCTQSEQLADIFPTSGTGRIGTVAHGQAGPVHPLSTPYWMPPCVPLSQSSSLPRSPPAVAAEAEAAIPSLSRPH